MQRSCWFKVQSLRFKEKQAADYKNFTQITQSSQIFLIKYKSFRTLDLCLPWDLCELLTANY